MSTKNKYRVIGIMSGTSVDGVDLAFCEFSFDGNWQFNLIEAETIPYDNQWKEILTNVHSASAEKIAEINCNYGTFLGKKVNDFVERNNIQYDFISSHGHTVFHQPSKRFNLQIGSGAYISAETGHSVVCDFRSGDIALGGQGAPLVPLGDKFLFSENKFCLNLGGIANISINRGTDITACDVCVCNIVLNYYAGLKGLAFDKDGELARSGQINNRLLDELNGMKYFSKSFPKSLGREDVEKDIFPLIEKTNLPIEDILATTVEHIAVQISKFIDSTEKSAKLLITGGGAFNKYLIERIRSYSKIEVAIPEKNIIEFKEAIIFAFLGIKRVRGEVNCLKSVTGAIKDNCSGSIFESVDKNQTRF